MADLRALLTRLALDDAFRAALEDDPDAVLAGLDLSPEHARALRARDDDWLALIGDAIRQAPSPPRAETPAGPTLPEARVALRLQAVASASGQAELQWAVSLHPWPPPAADPGAADFLVRVVPRATRLDANRLEVAYAASIQPAPSVEQAPDALPHAPSAWGHRTDTDAARAAAREALAAPVADRLDRLRALVAVVTGDAP